MVVAELKELNYQFKINIDMKNESNNNVETKAMPYDAMLCFRAFTTKLI